MKYIPCRPSYAEEKSFEKEYQKLARKKHLTAKEVELFIFLGIVKNNCIEQDLS